MSMSYNDWYESIQAIQLKPAAAGAASAATAQIDHCQGGDFNKNPDGRHLWIFINQGSPELCYYCSSERGGK